MSQESETEAWAHIRVGRFAEAETILRVLVGSADDEDHGRLCRLFGLLGSVLNNLGRHDDATGALRQAMNHGLQMNRSDPEANPHRYFLANQYLNFGDAEQALATIQVVPPGVGHVRCYLHMTAAKALRALGRQDEARRAAAAALAAAPNDEERSQVLSELGEMLEGHH